MIHIYQNKQNLRGEYVTVPISYTSLRGFIKTKNAPRKSSRLRCEAFEKQYPIPLCAEHSYFVVIM